MFHLNEAQQAKLTAWSEEQDALTAAKQGADEPYYGAIGGELTYSFTPTSLGVAVVVRHALTKNEINLTEYDLW